MAARIAVPYATVIGTGAVGTFATLVGGNGLAGLGRGRRAIAFADLWVVGRRIVLALEVGTCWVERIG